jgi:hypothetical protein
MSKESKSEPLLAKRGRAIVRTYQWSLKEQEQFLQAIHKHKGGYYSIRNDDTFPELHAVIGDLSPMSIARAASKLFPEVHDKYSKLRRGGKVVEKEPAPPPPPSKNDASRWTTSSKKEFLEAIHKHAGDASEILADTKSFPSLKAVFEGRGKSFVHDMARLLFPAVCDWYQTNPRPYSYLDVASGPSIETSGVYSTMMKEHAAKAGSTHDAMLGAMGLKKLSMGAGPSSAASEAPSYMVYTMAGVHGTHPEVDPLMRKAIEYFEACANGKKVFVEIVEEDIPEDTCSISEKNGGSAEGFGDAEEQLEAVMKRVKEVFSITHKLYITLHV